MEVGPGPGKVGLGGGVVAEELGRAAHLAMDPAQRLRAVFRFDFLQLVLADGRIDSAEVRPGPGRGSSARVAAWWKRRGGGRRTSPWSRRSGGQSHD